MPKIDTSTPVGKVLVWGVAAVLFVIFIMVLEGMRGENPSVNKAIDNVETNAGIDTQPPQPQTNPWQIAFFVLLGLVILALLIILGIWIYREFFEEQSWTL